MQRKLKKNSLPPVNWRWVEEGDGYVGRLQPPGQRKLMAACGAQDGRCVLAVPLDAGQPWLAANKCLLYSAKKVGIVDVGISHNTVFLIPTLPL